MTRENVLGELFNFLIGTVGRREGSDLFNCSRAHEMLSRSRSWRINSFERKGGQVRGGERGETETREHAHRRGMQRDNNAAHAELEYARGFALPGAGRKWWDGPVNVLSGVGRGSDRGPRMGRRTRGIRMHVMRARCIDHLHSIVLY